MDVITCILCELPVNSIKYNLQEHTTANSFTVLLHVLQYAVGEEIILNNSYICSSCYNLLSALERIELKAKEIKQRLCMLYQNYKTRYEAAKQAFIPTELPLQDISDSLLKAPLQDNKFMIADTTDNPKTHESSKETKRAFHCSSCNKYFVYKSRYETHLKKCNSNTNENVELAHEINNEEPRLNGNLQEFGDPLQVKAELFDDEDEPSSDENDLTENKERKPRRYKRNSDPLHLYPCPQCPKQWKTQSRLKAHLSTHESGTPYMCEICGQSYKHKTALAVHVGMHNGINPYTCTYCHKSFTQKGGLMRHVAIHTGEKHHQCDLCGKRFVHHTSFNIHKLSHTGEKTHKCPVCGLALMSASHLKRHSRVHTGERKYTCSTCGKRFAERYNLATHEKLHGGSAAAVAAAAAADRRKHRCQVCSATYDRKHKLEEHMVSDHNQDTQQVQTLGCDISGERNHLLDYGSGDCISSHISTLLKEHL